MSSNLANEPARVVAMFRKMLLIRAFEEAAGEAFHAGNVRGSVHQYIGEESIAVGICENLRDDDFLTSNHRGHGHSIAKGADPRAMMLELFGRVGGTSDGKGGSMHIADFSVGMLGANGVIADGCTISVGAAQSIRLLKQDRIVVNFIGDGGINRGPFMEALNWAKVYELPVLFVCENNLYAIHTHQRDRQPLGNIYERGAIYGIPGRCIEDGDVVELHDAAADALAALRRGEGPRLIETRVYRWKEHVGPLDELGPPHRSSEEARAWVDRDQLAAVCEQLESDERDAIESKVERELAEAIRFAEESPFPDVSALHTHVFGA